jgi:hypothetical protein
MTFPKPPPGKFIEDRLGEPVASEPEHSMVCPECGALFDMRNLGEAFAHASPLHARLNQEKKRAAKAL